MKNSERLNRYTLQIDFVEDEGFVATFRELGRSATGHGSTREEAYGDLVAAVEDLVEVSGESLPEPKTAATWSGYSGRVTLRLSRSLHCQLDRLAEEEGVSLNSLLTDILRSGATALSAGRCFGIAETSTRTVANDPNVLMIARSLVAGLGELPVGKGYERTEEPRQLRSDVLYQVPKEALA